MSRPKDFSEFSNIEQVVLEKVKLGLNIEVDAYTLHHDRDNCIERMSENVIMAFQAKILAKHAWMDELEDHEYVPADWWQHLRQRWFPEWWLERHPVKERKIRAVEQKALYRVCPHIKFATQKDQWMHYDFLAKGPMEWEEPK